MRRFLSLFPAALLCIAVASIGGRAWADPPRVLVHNGDTEDVIVTLTDRNKGDALVVHEQGVSASDDLAVPATVDSYGVYHLHWKVQDPSRTKTEEGDCVGPPPFACRIALLAAP